MKEDIQALRKCDHQFSLTPSEIGLKWGQRRKNWVSKKIFFKLFFSAPYSSPKGHPGDMRLNASVRDYKNLDLEGSFDLLALPQPEL